MVSSFPVAPLVVAAPPVGLALEPAQGGFDSLELTLSSRGFERHGVVSAGGITLTVLDVTSTEPPAAPPATGPGLSRNGHVKIDLVGLNPWSDGPGG